MHSDGVSCAVGTESGEVFMYDLRQNLPLATLHVDGPVKALQFAPPPKSRSSPPTQQGIGGSTPVKPHTEVLTRDAGEHQQQQASSNYAYSASKTITMVAIGYLIFIWYGNPP